MVLWCADVYSRKDRLLTQWRHMLVPMMPVCALVVALVVLQGDLGTALVLFAIVLGMLWIVGAPARLFVGSLLVVGVVAFGLAVSQPERVSRLTNFMDPIANYGSQGWQASHGFFALATGGLWGSGIGASNQKWGNLPGAHTDFIFAIIGEEFGLFGTLVVLALFVTLAYAGIRIAARTPDLFVKYASAGIVVWLLSQALINIGMVLGLLPVIGIPLPLISYGGSALLPDAHLARPAAVVRPYRAGRPGGAACPAPRASPALATADATRRPNAWWCVPCSPVGGQRVTPLRSSRPPTLCEGWRRTPRSCVSGPPADSRRG